MEKLLKCYEEDIVIVRQKQDSRIDGGLVQTRGRLWIPATDFTCVTLERAWRNNMKNISCIPPAPKEEAVYKYKMLNVSPSFNYVHLHILDVPDRTWIKIHAGNKYLESLGCPLVGDDYQHIDEDNCLDVTNSRATLAKLCKVLSDLEKEEGTIRIVNNS